MCDIYISNRNFTRIQSSKQAVYTYIYIWRNFIDIYSHSPTSPPNFCPRPYIYLSVHYAHSKISNAAIVYQKHERNSHKNALSLR